jgi:hypothetical protein
MTKHFMFASLASFAACATAPAPPTSSVDQTVSDDVCPADVPAALAPAAGQNLAFYLDATGSQIYHCSAAGAWAFFAPDALLYQPNGQGDAVVHHYAGPTWAWLDDGSTVVGKKLAAATVDKTAIPWLLLAGASHGPLDGRMSEVTAIQRLETSGGLAPAGACTPGDVANVPYSATYFFYRATDGERTIRCGAQ